MIGTIINTLSSLSSSAVQLNKYTIWLIKRKTPNRDEPWNGKAWLEIVNSSPQPIKNRNF